MFAHSHQNPVPVKPGRAAWNNRGHRDIFRDDEAVSVARRGAPAPRLPRYQGAQSDRRGCDNCHVQSHQGHDRQGRFLQSSRHQGALHDNRRRDARYNRTVHETGDC